MLIDGKDSDQIAADDRGLLYGDGLFETLAVRDGVPQLWPQHLARLQRDCARLGIVPPPLELLQTEALQLCAGHARAVLKIIITRGSGGRGYRLPEHAMPRRILSLHPWPDYPEQHATQGVRARLCTLRLGSNPRLAGIKHLNRLEQVLARAEWSDPDIAEGLLLDGAGQLVEGTMSNVFLVRDGCLLTPVLDECGVAGVMRAQILELAARLGIPGVVAPLRLDDVATAEEMFFCNSLIGLWPVRQFEQQEFAVGPLTRRLQQAIENPDHA
ncbi:MAG: aminodeoxychorismate lyase [Pseudomonadota bacterium]